MKKKSLILGIGVLAGAALAAQLSAVSGSDYDEAYDDGYGSDGSYSDEAYASDNYSNEPSASYESYDAGYAEPCSLYVDYQYGQAVLVAYAAEGTVGNWQLSFSQSGPGGTSSITQGGEIYPDGPGPIALSEISVPADGNFDATLTTYTHAGQSSCSLTS